MGRMPSPAFLTRVHRWIRNPPGVRRSLHREPGPVPDTATPVSQPPTYVGCEHTPGDPLRSRQESACPTEWLPATATSASNGTSPHSRAGYSVARGRREQWLQESSLVSTVSTLLEHGREQSSGAPLTKITAIQQRPGPIAGGCERASPHVQPLARTRGNVCLRSRPSNTNTRGNGAAHVPYPTERPTD